MASNCNTLGYSEGSAISSSSKSSRDTNPTSESFRAIAVKVYGSFPMTPGKPSNDPAEVRRHITTLPVSACLKRTASPLCRMKSPMGSSPSLKRMRSSVQGIGCDRSTSARINLPSATNEPCVTACPFPCPKNERLHARRSIDRWTMVAPIESLRCDPCHVRKFAPTSRVRKAVRDWLRVGQARHRDPHSWRTLSLSGLGRVRPLTEHVS